MAAPKALNLPELVEGILAHLPNGDILRLQGINSTWHNAVQDSPLLKHKLFLPGALQNVVASPLVAVNPLFRHDEFAMPAAPMVNGAPYVTMNHCLVYWAEPFKLPFKTGACRYHERIVRNSVSAAFELTGVTRENVLAIRQYIPASAQSMHLARSATPIDIHLSYTIKEKFNPAMTQALDASNIKIKKKGIMTAKITVRSCTLEELLLSLSRGVIQLDTLFMNSLGMASFSAAVRAMMGPRKAALRTSAHKLTYLVSITLLSTNTSIQTAVVVVDSMIATIMTEKASTKACRLPEIVFNILRQDLDALTILKVRNVCHTWRNEIDHSNTLLEKLFLKVPRSSRVPRSWNIILPGSWSNPLLNHSLRSPIPFRRFKFKAPRWACPISISGDQQMWVEGMVSTGGNLVCMQPWRKDILGLLETTPPKILNMYLTTPAIVSSIELYHVLVPQQLSTRYRRVAVTARVPLSCACTLGEYLLLCQELADRQPSLHEVYGHIINGAYHQTRISFTDGSHKQPFQGKMYGREVEYEFQLMPSSTRPRRYSAPSPITTANVEFLKDTPLPAIPSLHALRKEKEGLASASVFDTQELVDKILANLQAKENIRIQHLNKKCHKAVANNSTVEKKTSKQIDCEPGWGVPLYSRFIERPLGLDESSGDWDEVDQDETTPSPSAEPYPLVPWYEILGWEWTPDRPSTSVSPTREYSLRTGHIFDSFVIDMHRLCQNPCKELPPQTWPALLDMVRSRPTRSCFISLHYPIWDPMMHQCELHPIPRYTTRYQELHARAEVDVTQPEQWLNVIDACVKYAPDLEDVFKYDVDHARPTKHLHQSRCQYPWSVQKALASGVDYTFVLSR
ncbi:hypothetical protein M409DRAFT_22241 [Zasmidium cellare ATCC 36951]|uniref:F-box domain-containing protein n=1 Tax=Zasmidium cellare ATCC 36951 TaxID=1080233 RepID=A0A6A6CND7_ZASCE|nr:uncharacterized protein M409DRAFT_22241 [Zasmidium cellare ATCC 36951]KAF2167432.1 hypothetical protein M409DRAFT_22241 [Zasmidium cellare ATCC 36951]